MKKIILGWFFAIILGILS